MIGIRQKLILGNISFLTLIAVIGIITIIQIDQLGLAIDVILKQNYRSVVACQDMKESLERMDSGLLFTLAGDDAAGDSLIAQNTPVFTAALHAALHNITMPGEGERARRLERRFAAFVDGMRDFRDARLPHAQRRAFYLDTLQPMFLEMKDVAQDILLMNQQSMVDANDSARRQADSARRRMIWAIVVSALIAAASSFLAHRWILRPVNRLLESTNDIRNGNLDLVIEVTSHDEIGKLSESFNEMTAALRRARASDRVSLQRSRRATEEVFKALPSVIAVLDPEGRVEVATEGAERYFGLRPGTSATTLSYPWLEPLLHRALIDNCQVEAAAPEGYVQKSIDNREHFFHPMLVPIPVSGRHGEPTGAALILKEVTQTMEQRELKRGVVSTLSHQLRTPLTSLRMSIHILLEERVGSLTAKQAELLMAARDESERLVGTLDDLLNLSRIEAGKGNLTLRPVDPRSLVADAVTVFEVEARDRGIALALDLPQDLPQVMADARKIQHVYANLLGNALRFTMPGGVITLGARLLSDCVEFRVADTGQGIARENLPRLFEPFYRVPGQASDSGVGLGLSIAREIILAHAGDMGVESEPGIGSTFHFTLRTSD